MRFFPFIRAHVWQDFTWKSPDFYATLAEGETFTTIELKINFLRAVRKTTLTAEAKVVKAGSIVAMCVSPNKASCHERLPLTLNSAEGRKADVLVQDFDLG